MNAARPTGMGPSITKAPFPRGRGAGARCVPDAPYPASAGILDRVDSMLMALPLGYYDLLAANILAG
jgi:hypothetical protein